MDRGTTVTVEVDRSGDRGPVDGPDATTTPPTAPVDPASPPALAVTGASLLALLLLAVLLLAAGRHLLRWGVVRRPAAPERTG